MTNGPKKEEGWKKDEGCYVFPLYFLRILRLTDRARGKRSSEVKKLGKSVFKAEFILYITGYTV
jgi:hypothetical protein